MPKQPQTTKRCWPFWIGLLCGMFIMTPTHVSPEQSWENIKAWGRFFHVEI